jgi:hypothetical protein
VRFKGCGSVCDTLAVPLEPGKNPLRLAAATKAAAAAVVVTWLLQGELLDGEAKYRAGDDVIILWEVFLDESSTLVTREQLE